MNPAALLWTVIMEDLIESRRFHLWWTKLLLGKFLSGYLVSLLSGSLRQYSILYHALYNLVIVALGLS
jgi:hypothetical protein